MSKIYLDHNATTPLFKEVADEMYVFLTEKFGNPSSLHSFGRETKTAMESARVKVADLIGAEPGEIYFMSGGTESDNLAIKGVALGNRKKGNHIITSKIEHPAVLQSCKYLEKNGFEVSYINVDHNGVIDLNELQQAIKDTTILISVMLANNETGAIQPLEKIVQIAKAKGVLVHTDAVQAVGKIPVNVKDLNVDLLTFSSHKINGPKGVGAFYMKKGVRLETMQNGGHQEKSRRTGTENLPGIVGFGKACELTKIRFNENAAIKELRDAFEARVKKEIKYVTVNGEKANRTPNTSNICFHYIEGESIALSLDQVGIAVSTGSACASGSLEPSYVLSAMKVPVEIAQGAIRFSFGKENKMADIDFVISSLKKVVTRIRDMSPLYEDMIAKK